MGALTTTLATVGGVAGLALVAWPIAIWWEVRKCEKPRFRLLRKLGGPAAKAEVRLYAPYLCAEVTMKAGAPDAQGGSMDMRRALGGGFRQVRRRCWWGRGATCVHAAAQCALGRSPLLSRQRLPTPHGTLAAAAPSSQIAGFIFGKNVAPGGEGGSAKVAMTSPGAPARGGSSSSSSRKAQLQ